MTKFTVGIIVVMLTACHLVATPTLAAQSDVRMSGDIGDYKPDEGVDDPVHDPSLFHDSRTGTFYVASTGSSRTEENPGGIFLRQAEEYIGGPWKSLGEVPAPEWTKAYGVRHLWAPDVVQNGDWFYLYYSASSFGTNRSAIGVSRSRTPANLASWEDLGPILTSTVSNDYNAIDPYVFRAKGSWWIAFGSFWTGIKLQKMASLTKPVGSIHSLASRPQTEFNPIESPAIFKRGSYYYLLTAWDFCCRGVDSTYKTAVGRSTRLLGPYVDKKGKRLLQGGGTVVLAGRENQLGTGGGDVLRQGRTNFFIHHYYDKSANGTIRMQIRRLSWDGSGWPYFAQNP